MKIGIAQTKPVKGEVETNVRAHKKLIALAVEQGASLLVFPELSITGYEPSLAKELATTVDDGRFDDFQLISNGSKVTVGIGVPLQAEGGVLIGMVIFQPNKPRQAYTKQYLHSDELPYFIEGEGQVFLGEDKDKIALAICYEISVPEHAALVHSEGANVYLASVAKSAAGAEKAIETLGETARIYGMAVLFSNCIGHCDNFEGGGRSAALCEKGVVIAQLNDNEEGILILDTETGMAVCTYL